MNQIAVNDQIHTLRNDTDICHGIMCNVAQTEDRRIKRFFVIMIPTTGGLLVASVFSGYSTVLQLMKKEFFLLAQTVHIDFHIGPKAEILSRMILEEVANGNLVVFMVAVSTLVTVIIKYDLFSYPYRVRQVQKYKN